MQKRQRKKWENENRIENLIFWIAFSIGVFALLLAMACVACDLLVL